MSMMSKWWSLQLENRKNWFFYLLFCSIFVSSTACVYVPHHEMGPQSSAKSPPPSTEVKFYPNKGQSADQQDRDRYECYLWAVKKSDFDPSAAQLLPHQRLRVESVPPPGHDTASGAVAGAIIGATVSGYGNEAKGAAVGAVMGAIIGAASDAEREAQTESQQYHHDDRTASVEIRASNYRRAMSACLEGRGYTIK